LTALYGAPFNSGVRRLLNLKGAKEMKHLMRATLLVSILTFSSQVVYSCTCTAANQRRSFKDAAVVFIGRVIEVSPIKEDISYNEGFPLALKVKLNVEKSWKRKKRSDITVLSQQYTGWCGGFNFNPGERYLLYAYAEDKWLIADSVCARSSPLSQASEQVKNLNNFWYRLFARIYPF
jgi:hypothetical protein